VSEWQSIVGACLIEFAAGSINEFVCVTGNKLAAGRLALNFQDQ
jgi:hypothetical protein